MIERKKANYLENNNEQREIKWMEKKKQVFPKFMANFNIFIRDKSPKKVGKASQKLLIMPKYVIQDF